MRDIDKKINQGHCGVLKRGKEGCDPSTRIQSHEGDGLGLSEWFVGVYLSREAILDLTAEAIRGTCMRRKS